MIATQGWAMKGDRPLGIDGQFWLTTGGAGPTGQKRIALLESIGRSGSIAQAARDIGMSYKAAWQAVDGMNNLASAPLVERSAGGSRGGGTRLTSDGQRLIEIYRRTEAEFTGFLARLEQGITDFSHFNEMMRRLGMQTSARNELAGTVKEITPGAVNSEVILDLGGEDHLVAIITNTSVENLGLRPGVAAYALIKASWIVLADPSGPRSSARNCLRGQVATVTPGAVNAEISINLKGGKTLTTIVTMHSAKEMNLQPGADIAALIKASHVILAVNT